MEIEKKKTCASGVVLGIIGIVFALFIPAVSYSCSITGLAISVKKSKTHKSSAAIALNIVAISMAAINSISGILMTLKMFHSDKNEKNVKMTENQ